MSNWRQILAWDTDALLPRGKDPHAYLGWLVKNKTSPYYEPYGVIVYVGKLPSVDYPGRMCGTDNAYWAAWRDTEEAAIAAWSELTERLIMPDLVSWNSGLSKIMPIRYIGLVNE